MISPSDRTLIESVPVEWGNSTALPFCPSSVLLYLFLSLSFSLAVSNAPNNPTWLKAFKNAAAAAAEAESEAA